MTRVLETLKIGRALIEKGWTRGAYARDARQLRVNEYDPSAVCWCVTGAAGAAARQTLTDRASVVVFLDAAARDLTGDPHTNAVAENDNQNTQAAALAIYDRAIELAEKGQN